MNEDDSEKEGTSRVSAKTRWEKLYRECRMRLESERRSSTGVGAAIFAHEIGNRLNNLSLETQLLERGLRKESHPFVQRTQSILSEVDNLNTLLKSIQSLDQDRRRLEEPLDLAEVLADVIDWELSPAVVAETAIHQEVSSDLPRVLADRTDMVQIFLHLLQNALEAAPQKDGITVRIQQASASIVLDVQDTGVGVDDNIDVFRPLQTTKQGHWGLGLAIVRYLTNQLGGTIRYVSSLGVGSTFTVTLPKSQARTRQRSPTR